MLLHDLYLYIFHGPTKRMAASLVRPECGQKRVKVALDVIEAWAPERLSAEALLHELGNGCRCVGGSFYVHLIMHLLLDDLLLRHPHVRDLHSRNAGLSTTLMRLSG